MEAFKGTSVQLWRLAGLTYIGYLLHVANHVLIAFTLLSEACEVDVVLSALKAHFFFFNLNYYIETFKSS